MLLGESLAIDSDLQRLGGITAQGGGGNPASL